MPDKITSQPEPEKLTLYEVCALSDEELRRRIAKILGWTFPNPDHGCARHGGFWGTPPPSMGMAAVNWDVPDYPRDLNAMHEAEKHLGDDIDRWLVYDRELAESPIKFTWHATARQRAEAFVLTLSK